MPPALFALLRETWVDPTLKVAGTDPHLVELLREGMICSWLSTEGLPNVALTNSGTKPGDPLGDILFSFLMVSILGRLQVALASEGLLDTVEWTGKREFLTGSSPEVKKELCYEGDPSYMDDVALLLSEPRPRNLLV